MDTGKFIVFEGIDGSGKTTQAKKLSERLNKFTKAVFTCEPTSNKTGQMIREFLSGREKADARVIAALFAADRIDHLTRSENGICRLCDEGINVICDRYYFSSFAYQGAFVPLEWIIAINSESMKIKKPDLHIFIDIEPATAIKRIRERIKTGRTETEIFETLENQKLIRDKFFEVFDIFMDRENFIVISGENKDETILEAEIWDRISYMFT